MEYRMYGLVPYNISPIQQGIQFGHAVVEYGLKYSKNADYQKWANKDKTFIILNGGTTNNNPERLGTVNKHLETLKELKIKVAKFHEPDLGDQLTAVVFLVDEYVWNTSKYGDYVDNDPYFEEPWQSKFTQKELDRIHLIRDFLAKFKLA